MLACCCFFLWLQLHPFVTTFCIFSIYSTIFWHLSFRTLRWQIPSQWCLGREATALTGGMTRKAGGGRHRLNYRVSVMIISTAFRGVRHLQCKGGIENLRYVHVYPVATVRSHSHQYHRCWVWTKVPSDQMYLPPIKPKQFVQCLLCFCIT